MADSDLNPDIRRRDLYAVSLAIVLYNLAGGHLKAESSTIFGTFEITRPIMLAVGAAVLWAYFVWRFYLTSSNSSGKFRIDVDREIERSRTFVEFTAKQIEVTSSYLIDKARIVEEAAGGSYSAPSVALKNTARAMQETLDHRAPFRFKGASFLGELQKTGVVVNGAAAVWPSVDAAVWDDAEKAAPFTSQMKRKIVAGAILRAVYRRHTFSDFFLPLIVAALAPISVVVRLTWHLLGCFGSCR